MHASYNVVKCLKDVSPNFNILSFKQLKTLILHKRKIFDSNIEVSLLNLILFCFNCTHRFLVTYIFRHSNRVTLLNYSFTIFLFFKLFLNELLNTEINRLCLQTS